MSKLPPLPVGVKPYLGVSMQLEGYARAAVALALEEAAKVCVADDTGGNSDYNVACRDCAAAIRRLEEEWMK
jgi:hypothetical protein